ncbi:sugar ABC transporter ATP-binding protein [Falsibacillus pallidus]|uniref:sugar ABC transporter ATP-binding protein n=1 Tax=Falsibacillus pallidus TaxID=493781 RepID=UPI003D982171
MALLTMKNIHKTFGGNQALNGAQFELLEGEVHALLGANGAGKSTLMKIIAGVHQPDAGEIEITGSKRTLPSPRESLQSGIHCVYQEVDTAIVPELSVLDNLMLNEIASAKKWFLPKKQMKHIAKKALDQLNCSHISLEKEAKTLTLAEKQLLLIARAIIQDASILILDEPTAPLSLEETKHLFQVIKLLKKRGVGCIFISHRLPEIFEITDRLTIMRDGRTVATSLTSQIEMKDVVKEMLGKKLQELAPKTARKTGDEILEAKHISDGKIVKDVSFALKKGEVIGIAGLVGAGKTELCKLLAGASKLKNGNLSVHGKNVIFHNPADAIDSNIVYIPEERRREGLFMGESITKNLTFPHLKNFTSSGFLRKTRERVFSNQIIADLGIKAVDEDVEVNHLSGGNQQKVVIGKWLTQDAEIMIFDEPTKGVDVGAKQEIYQLIDKLAVEGRGIIYCSCEMSELLAVADRILVMVDGKIVKELQSENTTEEQLLLYASGGKEEHHERKVHFVSV